ncbi:hypothetical protein C0991_011854 [Blastosporella zonata]|nr:hypothetical protein C0991_011854 [Blastosporella zonata]
MTPLEAIKQTKVNMSVYLANYNLATDNGTAYMRQRNEIQAAIQTYGTTNIAGVTVGNEFMLDYLTANGGAEVSPNSDLGNTGAAILIANIQDTRSMLTSMGVTLSVGTSDAGSYFNTEVLQAVDYGMANVHPWFANVSAEDAASWTTNFFETIDVAAASPLSNNPTMYIAETGASNKSDRAEAHTVTQESSDVGNESNGPGTASESGLQTYLDNFICQANANGTGYFWFEYFDEPWKVWQ